MNHDKKSNERQALTLLGNTPNSKPSNQHFFKEKTTKPSFQGEKQENFSTNTTVSLEKEYKFPSSAQNLGVNAINPLEQTLKNALKDAIEENELLRKRVMELEALYAAAEDEIEKKDKAILELYEALLQKDKQSSFNTRGVLKKTEDFLNNPENVITVEMSKKQRNLLNKSF